MLSYAVGARYFIEDRMFVGFSATETQSSGEGFPFYYNRRRSRSGDLSLQLGYQFLGRLSAPDLVAPVRTPLSDGVL